MNLSNSTALSVRNPWAVVPSLGNLDAYISAVNRIPLLTHEKALIIQTTIWNEASYDAGLKAADVDLIVVATSTPLSVGVPGFLIAFLRGGRFVFEVRDLWPELPIAMGIVVTSLKLSDYWAVRDLKHVIAGTAIVSTIASEA